MLNLDYYKENLLDHIWFKIEHSIVRKYEDGVTQEVAIQEITENLNEALRHHDEKLKNFDLDRGTLDKVKIERD